MTTGVTEDFLTRLPIPLMSPELPEVFTMWSAFGNETEGPPARVRAVNRTRMTLAAVVVFTAVFFGAAVTYKALIRLNEREKRSGLGQGHPSIPVAGVESPAPPTEGPGN